MLRIAVDFNTMMMDPEERVSLNTDIAPELVPRLSSGQAVLLYDETLEVEAIIECDSQPQRWMARPSWATSRDLAPVAAMKPAIYQAD
jgi:hypothetical protein